MSPAPCSNWKVPWGRSASATAAAMSWAEPGAHSEGFNMAGQPAAKALASLWQAIPEGAFQGLMTAATPNGNRSQRRSP